MNALKQVVDRIIPPIYRHPDPPATSAEWIHTLILSADDEARPSPQLMRLGWQAVKAAREQVSLDDLAGRPGVPPEFACWPGEDYRLLAGLVLALRPKSVVEIGTGRGLATLALRKHLSPDARMVTVDSRSWVMRPDTALRQEDFADGRLRQHVGDTPASVQGPGLEAELNDAELVVVRRPEAVQGDGEAGAAPPGFAQWVNGYKPKSARGAIVVLDQWRNWEMLPVWRAVERPKMDMTSWGRWNGTGLIEIRESSKTEGAWR